MIHKPYLVLKTQMSSLKIVMEKECFVSSSMNKLDLPQAIVMEKKECFLLNLMYKFGFLSTMLMVMRKV